MARAAVPGRGPTQTGAGGRGARPFQFLDVRQFSQGRAHQLQGVEGGDAGPSPHQVHARVGGDEAPGGRGQGDAQQPALLLDLVRQQGKVGRDPPAQGVRQQRVLVGLAGKDPFRESGEKDHLKGSAAGLPRRPDEDPAVGSLRRVSFQDAEALAQDFSHLGEGHGPHLSHGLQFGQEGEHRVRPVKSQSGQPPEPLQPGAPSLLVRKISQKLDDRQGELPQVPEAFQPVPEYKFRGFIPLGVLSSPFRYEIRFQTGEPAFPPFPPADDGGVHQKSAPNEPGS